VSKGATSSHRQRFPNPFLRHGFAALHQQVLVDERLAEGKVQLGDCSGCVTGKREVMAGLDMRLASGFRIVVSVADAPP
jgi:hypothetical protein